MPARATCRRAAHGEGGGPGEPTLASPAILGYLVLKEAKMHLPMDRSWKAQVGVAPESAPISESARAREQKPASTYACEQFCLSLLIPGISRNVGRCRV